MRLRWFVAATLAAAACTPKPPPPIVITPTQPPPGPVVVPPVAPPLPPPPAGAAAIRFGPSALRYLVHRQIHTDQRIQGRTVTFDRGIRAYVSATILGPADSVGYPVTLTIDSMAVDSGTYLPPNLDLAAVRGLRYQGRVTPAGELRGLTPSDSVLAWTAAQVFGTFQGFYPRLPPTGVTIGAEWSDSVTTVDRGMVEVKTTTISHSRAQGWEDRAGTKCLRLEVTAVFSLAGTGSMGGQPRDVSGNGTRWTIHFIAGDGRYLGGEARDSLSITTTFPAEGETVPGTQVSRITVTVLP